MFSWTRDTPEEWVRELARLGAPRDRAAHLVLFWESGTPVEPVARYVIYEATPIACVPEWKLQAFYADPPCRCLTRWHPGADGEPVGRCPLCHGLLSPGRSRILDYLQRTECLALPFWVIQGHGGGHKHRYNQIEEQWQRMMGQPDTPPDPGSLAYAPFDQRVIQRLRQHNRAWSAFGNLLNAYAGEKAQAEAAFRKALLQYVDRSVEAQFDALTPRERSALPGEVRTDFTQDSAPIDLEAARDHFLTGV